MKMNSIPIPSGGENMLGCLEASARALARRTLKDFPILERRSPPLGKDDLLVAEVTLPLGPDCDVSCIRSARVRRPFARRAELMLVDVSRLPAA